MDLYERWIASPWREMPWWLTWVLSLVYLVCGYLVSQSVVSGLGVRLLLFVIVAVAIRIGEGALWRATHNQANN
jgi:hypothetical protein